MQVTEVDENGAVLVYRSGRCGFSKYLMGQLFEIAHTIYNLSLKIKVIESENDVHEGPSASTQAVSEIKQVVVKYRLDFHNKEYVNKYFFSISFWYIRFNLLFSRWIVVYI